MCVLVLVWRSPQRSLEDRARDCHRTAQCKSHEAQRRLRGGKTISFDCVVYTLSVLSETSVLIHLSGVLTLSPLFWFFICWLIAYQYSVNLLILNRFELVPQFPELTLIIIKGKESACVWHSSRVEMQAQLYVVPSLPPFWTCTPGLHKHFYHFAISPARVDWALPLRFP